MKSFAPFEIGSIHSSNANPNISYKFLGFMAERTEEHYQRTITEHRLTQLYEIHFSGIKSVFYLRYSGSMDLFTVFVLSPVEFHFVPMNMSDLTLVERIDEKNVERWLMSYCGDGYVFHYGKDRTVAQLATFQSQVECYEGVIIDR